MNEQIKVEFHREWNIVYGCILEMPEKLRGAKDGLSYHGYSIFSVDHPSLDERTLFLWGMDRGDDYKWFCYEYDCPDDAIHAINSFKELIKEWNEVNASILNDYEKRYLSNMIEPFKDRVTGVKKWKYTLHDSGSYDSVSIYYNRITDTSPTSLELPLWERDKLFREMEYNRNYTLEELGIQK